MSIATTRGDAGQTGLAGGIRISKADLRVETYGTTDELKCQLGLARSLCEDAEIGGLDGDDSAHAFSRRLCSGDTA